MSDVSINPNLHSAATPTIGHKRILPVGSMLTSRIRIRILQSKACPVLSEVGVF